MKRYAQGALGNAVWLANDFWAEFTQVRELKELTSTPYMVEIVMSILKELKDLQLTDASVKSELILAFGDEKAAQLAWQKLKVLSLFGSTDGSLGLARREERGRPLRRAAPFSRFRHTRRRDGLQGLAPGTRLRRIYCKCRQAGPEEYSNGVRG